MKHTKIIMTCAIIMIAFHVNAQNIALNDSLLQLRGKTDKNHGLRYDAPVDGAYLFGYKGGSLGSTGGVPNALRWDELGNVGIGIGNTKPKYRLEVVPPTSFGTGTQFWDYIRKYAISVNGNTIVATGNEGDQNIEYYSKGNSGSHVFYTNSTILKSPNERMRITGTGNVGIGTGTPLTKLDIRGNAAINNNMILLRSGTDNNHGLRYDGIVDGPYLFGYAGGALGTNGNPSALKWDKSGNVSVLKNLTIGYLDSATGTFNYALKFGEPSTGEGISSIRKTTNPNANKWGLDFWTAANVRMSIKNNGNVGIGVTNPVNKLEVCGTIRAKEVRVETGWCDYVFEKDYKLRSIKELEKFINDNKHLPGIAPASEVEKEGLKIGEMNKAMMEKIEELTLYVIQLSKDNKKLQKEVDALKK